MPEISQSSQATITQALAQLSQLASSSELSRQGVDVLVKHLAGNVLSLNKSTALLNKIVLLNNPEVKGKLTEGQTHQVKLSLESGPSLAFFSQASAKTTSVNALTEQQLQSLLRLPAKQLIPNNLVVKSDTTNKLPVINAIILSVSPKEQLSRPLSAEVNKPKATTNLTETKNTSMTNQQNILKVSLTDQRPPVEVALPVRKTNQFTVGEKVTLSIAPRGHNWQVTIVQNKPDAPNQLKNISGDNVQLRSQLATSPLTPPLSANSLSPAPTPSKIAGQILSQTPLTNIRVTETRVTSTPEISVPKDQQSILSPLLAVPIIKASLRKPKLSTPYQPVNFELPIKPVLQQLSKINNEQNQGLIQKLLALPINKLTLQVKPSGEFNLLVQSTKPVASIAITKEIAQSIAPLNLPNQQAVVKLLNLPTESSKQIQTPLQAPRPELNQKIQGANTVAVHNTTTDKNWGAIVPPVDSSKPKEIRLAIKEAASNLLAAVQQKLVTSPEQKLRSMVPPVEGNKPQKIKLTMKESASNLLAVVHEKRVTANVISPENKLRSIVPSLDGNKSQEIRLTMKEVASNLMAVVQQKPLGESIISPSLLANKSEQINLIQSLLRIVQAKAEAPAITLQSIEKALVDADFFKGTAEQPSKQLVEQVLQQIKQALPQGKEQDVNQIKQLLTTPALNLSTLQMINPTSSQGFMSGLVTLLQMSLSARLIRHQSSRAEHITATLINVLSGTSKVKPSLTSKTMGEMSQLEQKHQLMKEIGRLLSGHQTNKLSNAEQMIQGQETFYYNLPSALGGTFKDIELLIKREENNKEEDPSPDEQSNKTWQLTMKLAVGELGELLTKAKLRSDTLEINFYASNETVKIQVMNFLPLLRRKLDSLGIEVSKSQCQLGKIPDTLQQRPYHMFQAKA